MIFKESKERYMREEGEKGRGKCYNLKKKKKGWVITMQRNYSYTMRNTDSENWSTVKSGDRAAAAECERVLEHGWNALLPPADLFPWLHGRQRYLSEGCQYLATLAENVTISEERKGKIPSFKTTKYRNQALTKCWCTGNSHWLLFHDRGKCGGELISL